MQEIKNYMKKKVAGKFINQEQNNSKSPNKTPKFTVKKKPEVIPVNNPFKLTYKDLKLKYEKPID